MVILTDDNWYKDSSNSLYGVLGLILFRFYDIDNAEGTTTESQKLIQFTETIGYLQQDIENG